jgi:leucyl-tRNA synthetase
LAQAQTIEIAVQINGKVRERIIIPANADKDTIRETALSKPGIQQAINAQTIRKVIVVPGRIVNIVV